MQGPHRHLCCSSASTSHTRGDSRTRTQRNDDDEEQHYYTRGIGVNVASGEQRSSLRERLDIAREHYYVRVCRLRRCVAVACVHDCKRRFEIKAIYVTVDKVKTRKEDGGGRHGAFLLCFRREEEEEDGCEGWRRGGRYRDEEFDGQGVSNPRRIVYIDLRARAPGSKVQFFYTDEKERKRTSAYTY